MGTVTGLSDAALVFRRRAAVCQRAESSCTLDGMAVGCSQAYHMLDVGSAIPAALAPFQNLPGFSFESRGLGIFTAYIPGHYLDLPNGKDNGDEIRVNTDWQQERWETYFFSVSWSPQQQVQPTQKDEKQVAINQAVTDALDILVLSNISF